MNNMATRTTNHPVTRATRNDNKTTPTNKSHFTSSTNAFVFFPFRTQNFGDGPALRSKPEKSHSVCDDTDARTVFYLQHTRRKRPHAVIGVFCFWFLINWLSMDHIWRETCCTTVVTAKICYFIISWLTTDAVYSIFSIFFFTSQTSFFYFLQQKKKTCFKHSNNYVSKIKQQIDMFIKALFLLYL